MSVKITDDCIGCTACAELCPSEAIEAKGNYHYEINQDLCSGCLSCIDICPEKAIKVV